jgi:hypothetical protein
VNPYILIVAKQRDDVFCALFFDALPADLRRHICVREFGHDALAADLAGAAAVVVMRHGLFSFGALAASAGRAGVPRYHFLDDNLLLLRHEPEVYGPYWSEYTDANLRGALSGFQGVMLASRPLMRYFEEHQLHARLLEYPPMAWPVLRARDDGWHRAPGEPFRIAFFGGEHRRELFLSVVYPAAQRLAASRPVELVVVGIDAAAMPGGASPVRVVHLPYDVRYAAALETLAKQRVDVLAHPTPPSRNNPYRNANVLINARAVGAVAVLSNLAPYDDLGPPAPALLCDNDVDQWTAALQRLSSDATLCSELFSGADEYCRRHFSGRVNADVIRGILSAHTAPTRTTRAARLAVAGPALACDRAIFKARAIARRRLGRA